MMILPNGVDVLVSTLDNSTVEEPTTKAEDPNEITSPFMVFPGEPLVSVIPSTSIKLLEKGVKISPAAEN